MPTRSAADPVERSTNGSTGRHWIRKTSLLRIVPTACGQAADIALATRSRAWRFASPCDVTTLQRSEIAHRSRLASRSTLGAILPLHDVRYHAPAWGLAACRRMRKTFSADEQKSRLVEPDGIEPTTSCLQSRRSPN